MKYVYKLEDSSYAFTSAEPIGVVSSLVPVEIENEKTDYLLVTDNVVDSVVVGYSVSLDQGTKDAVEASLAAKQISIDAFQTLNDEITLDAKNTSGTSNQISALMDLLTYMRMKESPALFDQEGLVAKKDVGTFLKGDSLDNALKITQYSEAMLAETDAFMIRRLKKITDYINS